MPSLLIFKELSPFKYTVVRLQFVAIFTLLTIISYGKVSLITSNLASPITLRREIVTKSVMAGRTQTSRC